MNINQSALILIEFQREWLDKNGKIHRRIEDTEQFEQAMNNAEKALAFARNLKMPVIHCGLRFQDGYPELGHAVYGLRAAIPRAGTFPCNGTGCEFVPPFAPQENEFVVQGRTGASGFSGSNLDAYLRNQNIQTIYLAGFALHVCVESTLRQGHDLGYNTIVLGDACCAFTAEQKQYVLKHVIHHFGSNMSVVDFIDSPSDK